ncbi:MAG: hypothetical protein A3C43_00115, partial [Candidatus Schekmanbacteria bacterium RIFCSPHIGHO2_02_FULL_38_11]
VIIPAFNEENRIFKSLDAIDTYLSSKNLRYEIIVVDDGSNDNTPSIVKAFCKTHARAFYTTYGKNMGKGYAVRQGVNISKGYFVLFSDADLSTPIEEIEKLIKAIKSGYDISIGSRALSDSEIIISQPFYRKTIGKIFNILVRLLIFGGIKDTQCGFKCFTGTAVKKIFSKCRINGFSFDVEALFIGKKLGFKIMDIPIQWINSPESRVHPIKHSLAMIKELLQIRWNEMRGLYK